MGEGLTLVQPEKGFSMPLCAATAILPSCQSQTAWLTLSVVLRLAMEVCSELLLGRSQMAKKSVDESAGRRRRQKYTCGSRKNWCEIDLVMVKNMKTEGRAIMSGRRKGRRAAAC